MDSFFFVPSNRVSLLEKVKDFSYSVLVIDLEDAIYNSDINDAVDNIIKSNSDLKSFIRIAYNPNEILDKLIYLKPLVEHGFTNFIIPKIEYYEQFEQLVDFIVDIGVIKAELSFIVLVETPMALENISTFLEEPMINGVGFGSHDYCAITGMKHTPENILWARMTLFNAAKAYNKMAIDIASMNIENEDSFLSECTDGLEKGFDGKFIIHPWQLDIFNRLTQFKEEEISFAGKVKAYIEALGGEDFFTIANIDGVIVEKPHLKRIKKILMESGNESF